MKLTTVTVNKKELLPAGKAEVIHFDHEIPGFGLRIRAGGSRNWICQYERAGRQRRVTIGNVKVFNPDQARKAAREILARVRLGQDPQAERRKADGRRRNRSTKGTGRTKTGVIGHDEQDIRRTLRRGDGLWKIWRRFASLATDNPPELRLRNR